MSFNQELKDQRRLEKDKKNLEKVHKLVSDRQQRANEINALKSTLPRTKEGKQRVRLNGLRHGLTGQVSIMTDDNRREHDDFCNPLLARLNPDGPLELQLANLITHDHWRLNRIHSIEDGIFALGHMYKANDLDSGAPQADVALSEATTFMRSAKEILLLTTYTARTNRSIEKNMAELRRLQTERKAQLEKDLEEAQLLHQLAESKQETFDPPQNGFAFSALEFNFLVERNRQLKQARALNQPPKPIKKAA
jgi:hypothetical protein